MGRYQYTTVYLKGGKRFTIDQTRRLVLWTLLGFNPEDLWNRGGVLRNTDQTSEMIHRILKFPERSLLRLRVIGLVLFVHMSLRKRSVGPLPSDGTQI